MSNLNSSNNLLADLNGSSIRSSSLLNLLNISQQLSSPSSSLMHSPSSSVSAYKPFITTNQFNSSLAENNFYSSSQPALSSFNQQHNQFNYSLFSQLCSSHKTTDTESDRCAISPNGDPTKRSKHQSHQMKYSDSEKNMIYQ